MYLNCYEIVMFLGFVDMSNLFDVIKLITSYVLEISSLHNSIRIWEITKRKEFCLLSSSYSGSMQAQGSGKQKWCQKEAFPEIEEGKHANTSCVTAD